jgi:hypothetical protein
MVVVRPFIAAFILAIVLMACLAPLTSGRVIDRRFEPSHTETYPAQEMGCGWGYGIGTDGKFTYNYGCGRLVDVLRTRVVPDRWWITVNGCPDEGECREEEIQVTQAYFDMVRVGDRWVAGE